MDALRLQAEIEFEEEQASTELLLAIFQNYDFSGAVKLKEKSVKLELFFDTPPTLVIEAMRKGKIIEFDYEGDYQKETVKANPKQTEHKGCESEENKSVQLEGGKTKSPEKIGAKVPKKTSSQEEAKWVMLEELAGKATSYEHFVSSVEERLKLDQKSKVLFEELLTASNGLDKVSWKTLEEELNKRKIPFSVYYRQKIVHSIFQTLKAYEMSLARVLPFLVAVGKYKEYPFKQEENEASNGNSGTNQEESDVINIDQESETEKVEQVISKVKMKCMPENELLEKTLANFNKTQSIEEKIKNVLTVMGLEKKSTEEQRWIIEIANIAVTTEGSSKESILEECKIPEKDAGVAYMKFSELLNAFIKQCGSKEKVKLIEFLTELRKIVLESET